MNQKQDDHLLEPMLAEEEETAPPSTASAINRNHRQHLEQTGEGDDGCCCRQPCPEKKKALTARTRQPQLPSSFNRTPWPNEQKQSTGEGSEKDPASLLSKIELQVVVRTSSASMLLETQI